MDLVQSYMLQNFKGQPCVVFFDPLGDGSRVEEIGKLLKLPKSKWNTLVNADIYIHPWKNMIVNADDKGSPLSNFVNRLGQETYGFVMAWSGWSFVTENS